jgi:hypothetical protein
MNILMADGQERVYRGEKTNSADASHSDWRSQLLHDLESGRFAGQKPKRKLYNPGISLFHFATMGDHSSIEGVTGCHYPTMTDGLTTVRLVVAHAMDEGSESKGQFPSWPGGVHPHPLAVASISDFTCDLDPSWKTNAANGMLYGFGFSAAISFVHASMLGAGGDYISQTESPRTTWQLQDDARFHMLQEVIQSTEENASYWTESNQFGAVAMASLAPMVLQAVSGHMFDRRFIYDRQKGMQGTPAHVMRSDDWQRHMTRKLDQFVSRTGLELSNSTLRESSNRSRIVNIGSSKPSLFGYALPFLQGLRDAFGFTIDHRAREKYAGFGPVRAGFRVRRERGVRKSAFHPMSLVRQVGRRAVEQVCAFSYHIMEYDGRTTPVVTRRFQDALLRRCPMRSHAEWLAARDYAAQLAEEDLPRCVSCFSSEEDEGTVLLRTLCKRDRVQTSASDKAAVTGCGGSIICTRCIHTPWLDSESVNPSFWGPAVSYGKGRGAERSFTPPIKCHICRDGRKIGDETMISDTDPDSSAYGRWTGRARSCAEGSPHVVTVRYDQPYGCESTPMDAHVRPWNVTAERLSMSDFLLKGLLDTEQFALMGHTWRTLFYSKIVYNNSGWEMLTRHGPTALRFDSDDVDLVRETAMLAVRNSGMSNTREYRNEMGEIAHDTDEDAASQALSNAMEGARMLECDAMVMGVPNCYMDTVFRNPSGIGCAARSKCYTLLRLFRNNWFEGVDAEARRAALEMMSWYASRNRQVAQRVIFRARSSSAVSPSLKNPFLQVAGLATRTRTSTDVLQTPASLRAWTMSMFTAHCRGSARMDYDVEINTGASHRASSWKMFTESTLGGYDSMYTDRTVLFSTVRGHTSSVSCLREATRRRAGVYDAWSFALPGSRVNDVERVKAIRMAAWTRSESGSTSNSEPLRVSTNARYLKLRATSRALEAQKWAVMELRPDHESVDRRMREAMIKCISQPRSEPASTTGLQGYGNDPTRPKDQHAAEWESNALCFHVNERMRSAINTLPQARRAPHIPDPGDETVAPLRRRRAPVTDEFLADWSFELLVRNPSLSDQSTEDEA